MFQQGTELSSSLYKT